MGHRHSHVNNALVLVGKGLGEALQIFRREIALLQDLPHGGKHIKFMCVIAAPEGLERLRKAHPDVQIYVGHLDRQLNEKAYICPGLGDAGDRIFGTK